ncbi:MAG: hypothetical protein QM706_00525 [Nitrospira sp.]
MQRSSDSPLPSVMRLVLDEFIQGTEDVLGRFAGRTDLSNESGRAAVPLTGSYYKHREYQLMFRLVTHGRIQSTDGSLLGSSHRATAIGRASCARGQLA